MSTDVQSSLSLDIQRALQQAVGDANNAANIAKKKGKRPRDEDTPDTEDYGKVKKKKKSKSPPDVASTSAVLHSVPVPESAVTQTCVDPQQTTGDGKVKKRRKKNKGKEREQDVTPPQVEMAPAMPADLPTSSADFLSAVVAAASATQDQHMPADNMHFDQSAAPFMGYAPDGFVPYPYPHPPPPFGHPQHPPPMYHDPGLGIPDLNFASSEDLLRSLQDFDLSKVVNVLKTLGEAAAAANLNLNGQPLYMPPPPPVPQGPPPVKQNPVGSDTILGVKRFTPGGPSTSDVFPSEEVENPEHAHMLANVWMNAAKLAEMVKKEGLVYKKGKFSAIEEAQLTAAIENYRATKGLSQEDLSNIIFSKDRGRDTFWPEITSAVPLRPIIAVYHHVRRAYHPLKGQGKWMPSEDALLLQAVAELGQQWEKVSERVGRMSSDCRDRYRNHLQNREVRRNGPWSKEEEAELTRIVTEMTVEQGKDMDNDVFWGVVSERMGGRRGRQQCRIKWTDSLSPQVKNMGEKPRWGQLDAYILVHKVDSLNVRDDSEIDWKQLPDEYWNSWSAHHLQRRWLTMKRGIKGYEEMAHAEIMEILKTKKATSLPPPASNRRKKTKFTSAEAVDEDEEANVEAMLQVGSSSSAI